MRWASPAASLCAGLVTPHTQVAMETCGRAGGTVGRPATTPGFCALDMGPTTKRQNSENCRAAGTSGTGNTGARAPAGVQNSESFVHGVGDAVPESGPVVNERVHRRARANIPDVEAAVDDYYWPRGSRSGSRA